jgi:hypothetical protein
LSVWQLSIHSTSCCSLHFHHENKQVKDLASHSLNQVSPPPISHQQTCFISIISIAQFNANVEPVQKLPRKCECVICNVM